ncbi:flagellar basal body P-ring formation chaperone FlgA [bacterium]|nr:flagellar basal body P-ring formation chaperone FlgA [bacterium]
MIKFLLSLLFSFSCFASQDVELVIPSAVEVSPRSEISLYDIVEAKNLNDSLASELKDLVIPDSKANNMHKSELAKMLRSIKARFVLPSELKIIRSRGSISRMEVERKIKNKIYSQCSGCEVQVQISSVPTNMESDWSLDLNVDLSKSSVTLPIVATKNSDLKGWVVAEIKRYQSVPVVSRSIKIGDVLTEDMFTVEKRQLTNSRDTVQKIESVIGMQAIRFLTAGQVLQYGDIKKEQVLKKGQMVKAMFGTSDFEVAISAEAQEAGSVGDVVKIKNIDSQKVFAAKIIERGLVRIE